MPRAVNSGMVVSEIGPLGGSKGKDGKVELDKTSVHGGIASGMACVV